MRRKMDSGAYRKLMGTIPSLAVTQGAQVISTSLVSPLFISLCDSRAGGSNPRPLEAHACILLIAIPASFEDRPAYRAEQTIANNNHIVSPLDTRLACATVDGCFASAWELLPFTVSAPGTMQRRCALTFDELICSITKLCDLAC
jgi:hypothetical protein